MSLTPFIYKTVKIHITSVRQRFIAVWLDILNWTAETFSRFGVVVWFFFLSSSCFTVIKVFTATGETTCTDNFPELSTFIFSLSVQIFLSSSQVMRI